MEKTIEQKYIEALETIIELQKNLLQPQVIQTFPLTDKTFFVDPFTGPTWDWQSNKYNPCTSTHTEKVSCE